MGSVTASSLGEEDSTYFVNAPTDGLDVFTVDVIIKGYKPGTSSTASENAHQFFETTLLAEQSGDSCVTAVKLLLPSKDGYVSRSDMVAFRLRGLDVEIHSFLTPRQLVKAVGNVGLTLYAAINNSIGAIVSTDPFCSPEHAITHLKQLELELKQRLALPWLLPDPIPYKRVALVGGLEEPQSLASIKAMGIGLIILDKPGNMFENNEGPFGHLREEFIPFNVSPDKHAPQRIVDALRDKQIDGIHTRYDIHHTNVAKANGILGLPTSDPEGYAIATDKFAARALEPNKNSAFRVQDVEELKSRLPTLALEYPLIVKPTTGRNSWGVLRCDNKEQLIEATAVAHDRLIGTTEDGDEIHSEVMIEPYVDGPEFDVDMRFLAFAVPRPRDPDHVCALHFILPEKGGILKSPDPGPELAKSAPELMKSIPLYYNEFEMGQYVPPPVSTNFLFMTRMAVESHKGRDGLLKIIRDIRREWTFVIEEE
ncbi:hypothetical protein DV737_g3210, partial [Chaetothyriales sp. CBS 132003]